jgi:Tfp pilus assembly protein PilV
MSTTIHTQRGSSLVEILVSIVVTGIVAMALSNFSSVGYRLLTDSRERAIAQQVVASTIEELSLRDLNLLTSSTYSDQITRGRVSLTRTVTIASNADNSRSVEVSAHKGSSTTTRRTLATMSARLTVWSTP